MTGAELLRLTDELDDYYREFDDCVARCEGRKWLRVYARGQLGPLERKSLEPIADAEGVAPRTLQWFFMRNGWDEDRVLAVHQRRVAEELGGEDGIFVIDETSDAKKGEWTAGVARQYCGESGKIDNGIVSVHVAYVREARHALLDGELFLPERWNPDSDDPSIADKRRRAQLPPEVVHRPKTAMALEQLDRARAHGIGGRYVSADELYGGAPWWRAALAERGLIYVVEVPSRIQGWIGERDGEARSLKDLAATDRRLRCGIKKRYTTHETAKGPEVWEARRVRFIEQAETAPAVAQDLLVARNPRTGELKYFLTQRDQRPAQPAHPGVSEGGLRALARGALLPGLQERTGAQPRGAAHLPRPTPAFHPHRGQLLLPAEPGAGKKSASASASWPMRCRCCSSGVARG